MAGVKRAKLTHDGAFDAGSSPFVPMFEQYRAELDEHHDRRERIIKASRDVTALSKKIIFSLQRVRKIRAPLPPAIEKDIAPKYESIKGLLSQVAGDLEGINAHRYYRQISGGLQEFMEAVSFQHYLQTQSLITYEESMKALPEGLYMSQEDYLLGVFDMTGELMRLAITIIATAGQLPSADGADGSKSNILIDMQHMRMLLEGLDTRSNFHLGKEVDRKMSTMRQSVEKVENGVYEVIVRGKERPKGWVPDLKSSEAEREVEAY